jgi:hypothetical protein
MKNSDYFYLTSLLCAFFVCLLSFKDANAQTNTYAPGHLYIYSEVKNNVRVFGLCDKTKKVVVHAQYKVIRQEGLFLLCENQKDGSEIGNIDIYNAWGKLLTKADLTLPLNDSIILVCAVKINNNKRLINKSTRCNTSLVHACGQVEDKPFEIINKTDLHGYFVIAQGNGKGLYNALTNQVILPPEYDTVMYKPDSFFLGWSGPTNYKLMHVRQGTFKSPPVVYQSDRINFNATIFGVDLRNGYSNAYNNKGVLIDSFAQFRNWMTVVLGNKNIDRVRSIRIVKIDEKDWSKEKKSYLLDADGKPILDPAINKDSSIHHAYGYLYVIKSLRNSNTGQYMAPYAVFSAYSGTVVQRADTGKTIVNREGQLMAATEDYFEYLDAFGNVAAKTVRPPKGNIADVNKKQVIDRRIFWSSDGKYQVPAMDGRTYYFDEVQKLDRSDNKSADELKYFYAVKVKGKWGICKIEPTSRSNSEQFMNERPRLSFIARPDYETVYVSRVGNSFIFQLLSDHGRMWIDSTGKIIAGSRDFSLLSVNALQNGHRIAYATTLSGNDLIATRIYLIDSMGRILKTIAFDESEQISAGDIHLVDDDQVIYGNMIYDLNTGKSKQLLHGFDKYTVFDINGRAVLLSGGKGSKPGLHFNTKVNNGSYKCMGVGLKDGVELPQQCGLNTNYFFHDARGEAGFIVSEDGDVYQ